LSAEHDDFVRSSLLVSGNGAYQKYYRHVHDTVLSLASNPVPPLEAIAVMRLLEGGQRSDAAQCGFPFDVQDHLLIKPHLGTIDLLIP
jgi:hypothetical protein